MKVRVEGWKELSRDLRKMAPEARKDAREALKAPGVLVRDEARSIARSEGLVDTGALVRKMSVSLTGRGVEIRATATHPGDRTRFNYPRRYEFGGRPFLNPALESKGPEAVEAVLAAFDRLARKYELE